MCVFSLWPPQKSTLSNGQSDALHATDHSLIPGTPYILPGAISHITLKKEFLLGSVLSHT